MRAAKAIAAVALTAFTITATARAQAPPAAPRTADRLKMSISSALFQGMPEALEYLHRRQALRPADSPPARLAIGPRHAKPEFATVFGDRDEAGLPAPIRAHSRVNPQFRGTRHVNRV